MGSCALSPLPSRPIGIHVGASWAAPWPPPQQPHDQRGTGMLRRTKWLGGVGYVTLCIAVQQGRKAEGDGPCGSPEREVPAAVPTTVPPPGNNHSGHLRWVSLDSTRTSSGSGGVSGSPEVEEPFFRSCRSLWRWRTQGSCCSHREALGGLSRGLFPMLGAPCLGEPQALGM